MSKYSWVFVLIVIALGLAGCAAARAPQFARSDGNSQSAVAPSAPAEGPQPSQTGAKALESDSGALPALSDAERKIVRTADLAVVVTDAEPAIKSITDLTESAGGYVSESKAWREGEQLRAHITARIPAEQLDSVVEAIKKLGVRVERDNVTGQDVTEEYSDLNAQLTNLEATEKELRELLSEVRQRTQKAEDILQVYRELTTIRGEIERVKGRIQYLGNLTALATVSVDLIPDALAKPVVEPGWRPLETLRSAGRALVNSLKGIADVLIWLVVYLLPVLIVIAIPIVLVILLIRWAARRGRRGTKSE